MNEYDAFDQSVADLVASEGATGAPPGAVDELITATSRVRPLPRWLALIKEPPMRRSSAVAVGSPTVRLAAIALSTILLLVLAGGAVAGAMQLLGPPTHTVSADGTGDFMTISDAVDAAKDGDRILVKAGRYTEAVKVVGKDVEIRGDGPIEDIIVEGRQTELGSPTVPEDVVAFYLEDTTSTVARFTIAGPDDSWAVIVTGPGSAPTLEDLYVPFIDGVDDFGRTILWDDGAAGTLHDSDVSATLYVWTGATPTITKSRLNDCIAVRGEGARPVFIGNRISGCPRGFLVFIGDGFSEASLPGSAELRGNRLHMETVESGQHQGNYAVIVARSDVPVLIEDNDFIDNKTAIAVRTFAEAEIVDNDITGGETGVWIEGAASIRENRILDNSLYGLLIHGSPTIADNAIEGSLVGVNLGSSAQPELSGNAFCRNETDLNVPDGNPTTLDGNEVCGSAG